jgi:hypothetical protein
MKKLLILCLAFFPFALFSQVIYTPYISTGYINHLGRTGINTEIGIDAEILRRLDLSANYRYSKATHDAGNDVTVSGLSANASFIIINRGKHRFMLGTGFTYGRYERYTDYLGFEKAHRSIWFDPVKIRYDYTIMNRLRIGAIASLTGEDGDGSTYVGILAGCKF